MFMLWSCDPWEKIVNRIMMVKKHWLLEESEKPGRRGRRDNQKQANKQNNWSKERESAASFPDVHSFFSQGSPVKAAFVL